MEKTVDPKTALRVGVWLLGLTIAIIALVAIITSAKDVEIDSALAVSGGIIVIVIALAGLTAIIGALGLSGHPEAFALPGGTVRSVLALGILTVLIFFALNQFKTTFAPTVSPVLLREVTLSAAAGETTDVFQQRAVKTIDEWKKADLTVISLGKENGLDKYALYRSQTAANDDGIDFAKQLLVMLGTLLTSIISFYFGSRVAEDARKPSGVPGSSGIADMTTAKTQLGDLKKKRADLKSTSDELNALLAEAKANLSTMDEAARPAAQAIVDNAERSIAALAAAAAAADEALAKLETSIPADGSAAPDWTAVNAATAAAASKIGDLEKAYAATASEREKLMSIARAEG